MDNEIENFIKEISDLPFCSRRLTTLEDVKEFILDLYSNSYDNLYEEEEDEDDTSIYCSELF